MAPYQMFRALAWSGHQVPPPIIAKTDSAQIIANGQIEQMGNVVSIIGGSTETQRFVEQTIARNLADRGIEIKLCSRLDDSAFGADLVIAQYPLPEQRVPPSARILGQRVLDRKSSLLAAEQAGAPVARWASPNSNAHLRELSASWGHCAVVKYGWSTQRNGVFLWSSDSDGLNTLPDDFDPDIDICMEFLGDDPTTYKVDLFCGSFLASWMLKTRSMRDADWHSVIQPITLFAAPSDTVERLKKMSLHMLQWGAGYMSVDLMRVANDLKIIEVNPCRVATMLTWSRWPQLYAMSYARGIEEALKIKHLIPRFGDVKPPARQIALQAKHGRRQVSLYVDGEPALGGSDVPFNRGALTQKLVDELRISERKGRAQLLQDQNEALAKLVRHAQQTAPFYRKRLASIMTSPTQIDWQRWQSVPLLLSADIRNKRMELVSRAIPAKHGLTVHRSVMSRDGPLTITTTTLADCMNEAISCRNLEWHKVDASQSIACILRDPLADVATAASDSRGPRPTLSEATAARQQLEWLSRVTPQYLETTPENVLLLARTLEGAPSLRPTLRAILTRGCVSEAARSFCQAVFGCELIDAYVSKEAGFLALRCPETGRHHVQSEAFFVELVRADGSPCAEGETGGVVVTPLLSYAVPLIRHSTGHSACAIKERCRCGRDHTMLSLVEASADLQVAPSV